MEAALSAPTPALASVGEGEAPAKTLASGLASLMREIG